MNQSQLLKAITDIKSDYINSAGEKLGYHTGEGARRKPHSIRRILLPVAAVVAALTVLCASALAINKELRDSLVLFFGSTFSPDEVTVSVEGEMEIGLYEAVGKPADDKNPGFRIYYDTQRYSCEMTETGCRIYSEPDDSLPYPCDMEITHIEHTSVSTELNRTKAAYDSTWEVYPAETDTEFDRSCLDAYKGVGWDAPCENHYFYSDYCGGVYRITCRYFMEAAEGHGSRFTAMANTFSVLAPLAGNLDTYEAQYSAILDAYRDAMHCTGSRGEYAAEHDLSEFITATDSVGYTLLDIDGNGIPELLIGCADGSCYEPNVIFDLYTMVNGTPQRILHSWPRARFYLLSGNRIILPGSGGAASTVLEFCTLQGSHLIFLEGYSSTTSFDDSGTQFYHTSHAQYEEGVVVSGDYDRYDSTLTLEEADILFQGLEAKTVLPPLEKID